MIPLKTRTYQLADPQQYPAVEVTSPGKCCAAAKALEGRLMLATAAPRLPLADCADPAACECRFRKHPDRRMGDDDRRFPYEGQRATWFTGSERRGARGRRSDDD
jgi:hypothetical protein